MQLFYAEDLDHQIFIRGKDYKHLKAFRCAEGDEVLFTDGKGQVSRMLIDKMSPDSAELHTLDKKHVPPGRSYHLQLFVTPTKNHGRMEWMLEKLIEIGVDEISFTLSKHSERKHLRLERLQRKAIAAMKQSKKYNLPKINDIRPFEELIIRDQGVLTLFPCLSGSRKTLSSLLQGESNPAGKGKMNRRPIQVFIGPEGGFSAEEIAIAEENNAHLISLGDEVLRTETAAIFIANSCYYEYML